MYIVQYYPISEAIPTPHHVEMALPTTSGGLDDIHSSHTKATTLWSHVPSVANVSDQDQAIILNLSLSTMHHVA